MADGAEQEQTIDFDSLPNLEIEQEGFQQSAEESGSTEESGPTGINPAWNELFEKIPAPFHESIKPDLQKWDTNFHNKINAIRQEYSPYQQFIDNKISPERLQESLQFAELVEKNPQAVYEYLQRHLGLTPQQAQEVTEELTEEESSEVDTDPVLAQLQKQQQQVMQFLEHQYQEQQQRKQQEEYEAQVQQYTQKIDDEFAEIEKKHGKLSDEIKKEVITRAMHMNSVSSTPVSMHDAFNSLVEFVNKVRQTPRPGDLAPPAFGSGNGIPTSRLPDGKTLGQLTPSERKQAAIEVLSRIRGQ